jgi:predicted nuclease of predicted toxin-antitoxin system
MAPGISDEAVLSESRSTGSILITSDKDFGELVFRRHEASTGVLLVRLSGVKPETKAALVSAAIRGHADELAGAFAVLSVGSLRIRRDLFS